MRAILLTLVCLISTNLLAQPREVQVLKEESIRRAAESVADRVVQLRFLTSEENASLGASLSQSLRSTAFVLGDGVSLLTSDLHLDRDPAAIIVSTSDNAEYLAELVARDYARRLVLLRLKEVQLNLPQFEISDTIQPGESAIALGRGYEPQDINLSVGIISATNRLFGKAIQTDAAISAVNYGGPLINLEGKLIGIISPVAPQGQRGEDWYDSGIGFAIPMKVIERRLDRLQAGEDVHAGWIGMKLKQGNPYTSPPIVEEVRGPAWKARLKHDDRILSINGTPVETITDFRWEVRSKDAGESIQFVYDRDGQEKQVSVVLEKRPQKRNKKSDEPKLKIQPKLPIP